MGHALAIVFAKRGLEVFLVDIGRGKLDQARNLIKSYLEFSFSQGLVKESPEAVPFDKNIYQGYKMGIFILPVGVESACSSVEDGK
jgi:hypothetical protein